MTTVVDQVITIFDAVWKGDNAAKSAMLSLDQYRKMSSQTGLEHMKLASQYDSTARALMNLGAEASKEGADIAKLTGDYDKHVAKLNELDAKMKGVADGSTTLGDKFKGLVGDITKIGLAIGGAVIAFKTLATAMQAVYKAGQEGAQVAQLTDSFDHLNVSVMHTPTLLRDMIAATDGTMSKVAAMNSIMTLVAGSSETLTQEFARAAPRLAEIAKAANKLNPTLGTTDFMFQSIARGIKRLEPRLLDNLGLNVRMASANTRWAEANDRTVESMTAEEKVMAALNETMRVGANLIEQVGGTTESVVDPYLQLSSAVTDLKNAYKELLALQFDGTLGLVERLTIQEKSARLAIMQNEALAKGIYTTTQLDIDRARVLKYGWGEVEKQYDKMLERLMKYDEYVEYSSTRVRDKVREEMAFAAASEAWTPLVRSAEEMDKAQLKMMASMDRAAISVRNEEKELEELEKQSKENVKIAKELVSVIDKQIEAIRKADAATGDYAIASREADKESSLFNQTIDEIGPAWVEVGGRTKEQNELLEDLQGAYDKAEKGIRDYSIGIKGVGQEQKTVNKRLEDYNAQMGILLPQIEALKNIQGDVTRVNREATWNQENINQALIDAADAAGANAEELVNLMLATGDITEEQAQAILAQSKMREAIATWGQQVAEGIDADKAIAELDRLKQAFLDMSFDELRDKRKLPRPWTADEVGAFAGDVVGTEFGIEYTTEDTSSVDGLVRALEDIRAGAEAFIEVDGDMAQSELDDLVASLNELRAGANIDIDITTRGELPEPPPSRGGPREDAFGGPIGQGAVTWVGERGPELFVPNVNGRIYPNGVMPGGMTVNNYNYNKEAAAIARTMFQMRRRQAVDSLAGVA